MLKTNRLFKLNRGRGGQAGYVKIKNTHASIFYRSNEERQQLF
jgi:hypothetical protein